MRQHVLFHMLLLLEGFVAPLMGTLEGPLVAAHVPIKLAFTYEVAVDADWALKFCFLFDFRCTDYNRSIHAMHIRASLLFFFVRSCCVRPQFLVGPRLVDALLGSL